MAIRSGRFRAKIEDVAIGVKIITGRTDAFYRIFNSCEDEFIVKPKGAIVKCCVLVG